MLSNIEIAKFCQVNGVGKMPITGGPSSLTLPTIAQSVPYEVCNSTTPTPTSGVMELTSIYLTTNTTISNINCVSGVTAESGGSHLWFALYDDGRSSTVSGQLGLLEQTADQTGAAAFPATTNLGLSLLSPYLTTYSGIYYIAFMCAATTVPNLAAASHFGGTGITLSSASNSVIGGTAGSSLTSTAPNPSGAVTAASHSIYAYVS
jgi:hypothetical protein